MNIDMHTHAHSNATCLSAPRNGSARHVFVSVRAAAQNTSQVKQERENHLRATGRLLPALSWRLQQALELMSSLNTT